MTVRLSGTVTRVMFLGAARALLQHPGWNPDYDVLWDGRGVRQLVVSEADVAQLSTPTEGLLMLAGRGRRAVVTSRALDHMIATLFVARTRHDGRNRRVFSTLEDALAWLDAGEDEPEAETG